MINVLDYTSYPEIRATIGLSIDELPDAELELEIYANSLEIEMDSLTLIDATHNPIKEKFFDLDPDDDSTVYNQTRIFATYSVALEAAISLSIKTPKSLTDSKVGYSRWSSESAFKDVIAAIRARIGDITGDLEGTSTEALPLFAVIKPDYDPVLG